MTNWTHENLAISVCLIPHMNFRLNKNDFTGPFIDFFTIFKTMIFDSSKTGG